jgi:hypothetical protein
MYVSVVFYFDFRQFSTYVCTYVLCFTSILIQHSTFCEPISISNLLKLLCLKYECYRGRFLNRVQVEKFASSKLEVIKFIPIKFASLQLSSSQLELDLRTIQVGALRGPSEG